MINKNDLKLNKLVEHHHKIIKYKLNCTFTIFELHLKNEINSKLTLTKHVNKYKQIYIYIYIYKLTIR